MQLQLSDDQEFLRETARRFLTDKMPLEEVRRLYPDAHGFDRSRWRDAAALGWTSMFVPEAQGGGNVTGRPVSDVVIIAEEIGRLASPGPFAPSNLAALAIARAGPTTPHNQVLADLVAGESIVSWAFAEPGDQWALERLRTEAHIDGGQVVINGHKAYVEAAISADYFVVTARAPEGVAQILVPARADGLTVVPGRSVDITRRFGRIDLTDVRLPLDAVVGEFGRAADSVQAQVALGIALQCAEIIGLSDHVLTTTVDYGRDRIAFGRPIVSFQEPKHRIAGLFAHLEGMKAIGEALTRAIDDGAADIDRLSSVAKAYVADHGLDLVDECVQITGGLGVTWEHDIHIYSRRALIDHTMLGTPEYHRDRLFTMLHEEMG